MRLFLFIGLVCLGALLGLATALHDDTSTQVGMALVGALFAAPVAALIARRPASRLDAVASGDSIEPAGSSSPRALSRNYWRDKGHPPFMRPSDIDPERNMFDRDRHC